MRSVTTVAGFKHEIQQVFEAYKLYMACFAALKGRSHKEFGDEGHLD